MLLVASGDEIAISALYLPAVKFATFTETITLLVPPVESPLVGLRSNQAASSFTDQFNTSPPEFHIPKVWTGGLSPPGVALKMMEEGLYDMLGCVLLFDMLGCVPLVHDIPATNKLITNAMITMQNSSSFMFHSSPIHSIRMLYSAHILNQEHIRTATDEPIAVPTWAQAYFYLWPIYKIAAFCQDIAIRRPAITITSNMLCHY
jgi:hypothetical protein